MKKVLLTLKVIIDWLTPLNFKKLARELKEVKNKK